MGGWIDIAVSRPHGYAERMANLRDGWIINFIVPDQSGKNRQSRRIRRCPSVGPAIIGIHIEKRSRAGKPFSLGRVVINVIKLVEIIAVSVDDQQMAVLTAAQIDVSRVSAFNPIGLGNCFWRDRIERKTRVRRVVNTIAFAGILKLHRFEISAGDIRHDRVGHPID